MWETVVAMLAGGLLVFLGMVAGVGMSNATRKREEGKG